MLGLQALDCYQTATLEGSPRSYADPKESTIIDARYVECFTFVDMCCCSALHSAAILMQVIVADSTFECSQSGRSDGRPRLPFHTVATGSTAAATAPHRDSGIDHPFSPSHSCSWQKSKVSFTRPFAVIWLGETISCNFSRYQWVRLMALKQRF